MMSEFSIDRVSSRLRVKLIDISNESPTISLDRLKLRVSGQM